MNRLKGFHIDERYIDVNITRSIIIYAFLTLYCIYLSVDNYVHGNRMIGMLALFCAVMTGISLILFMIYRFGKNRHKALMHIPIIIQCFVYWFTFGMFLFTGGTGGTSIFLIFAAAPVCFFFFNLFYGSIFCSILFIGMFIYMQTPLHLLGYRFPEMYYDRLPMMYLVEVIMCAIAQYETDRAKIKQDAALEEARAASEAKTDFLANTSHEIRTPINAVLGMNEMILRESARAEKLDDRDTSAFRKAFRRIRTYAGNVDSAGNNLLSIINDILDFSKIEEGKMEIVEIDYSLSSVLNDVSNMIHFKAKDKSLDFITDIDGSIPDGLHGDEVRIRQILTNLLTNAVKYTDEGSITLKVRSNEPAGGPGGQKTTDLVISVSDTGIGIKAADVQKLFAKFERIDLEKNSTIEGTGLGLAITKNLLDMMGGKIHVESHYEEGSTFTVTIPQTIVSPEPVGDFKSRFRKQLGMGKNYHASFRAPSAKILVVDDTRMNLIVATEFLKDTQIMIDTANSGAEAIHAAENTAYDIILMDQRMPGMDGTEALRRIRSNLSGPNLATPVICLTADAVTGARERYLAKGFSDYITKPIDSVALENMLMRYLPPDKITAEFAPEEKGADYTDEAVSAELKKLDACGIDTQKGLYNCGGDESFYISVLTEYTRTSADKKERLHEYLDKRDLENYGVLVHSLKSTSRTIGAAGLGSIASKLEKAAKGGDADTLLSEHDDMIMQYDAILEAIRPFVSGKDTDAAASSDDSEILEFDPE